VPCDPLPLRFELAPNAICCTHSIMEMHPCAAGAAVAAAAASPQTAAENVSVSKPWLQHPGVPSRVQFTPKALSSKQLEQFDRDGFLLIKAADIWTPEELKALITDVAAMEHWPDAPGKYMKYYEANRRDANGPKLLQRIENFTQYAQSLEQLCGNDSKLCNMAGDLLGEKALLYKEKVNYKLAGGGGFAPHQDVAAGWWMYGQTIHISCLVSIDAATVENGCLEVVAAGHRGGMISDEWKEIPLDTVDKLKWITVPTEPGDVLFFDSYVPHRSGPNDTDKPRRVLYSTYAKACEGDLRDRYYADKRKSFPPDCEREEGKKYEYKI